MRVVGGGTLSGGASGELLANIADGKAALSGTELFLRSVLCNFLVCLALWMAARTTNDAAKLGVLWWALLAFIASGFEHSVANMTIFGLAALEGSATWLELARNLLWTVPGNIVGGGLLVGVAYSWLNGAAPATLKRSRPAATGLAGDASADGEGDAALTAVELEGERPGEAAAEPAGATAAARSS
jgi:formate/nitrite transporter FocA (FNT family)